MKTLKQALTFKPIAITLLLASNLCLATSHPDDTNDDGCISSFGFVPKESGKPFDLSQYKKNVMVFGQNYYKTLKLLSSEGGLKDKTLAQLKDLLQSQAPKTKDIESRLLEDRFLSELVDRLLIPVTTIRSMSVKLLERMERETTYKDSYFQKEQTDFFGGPVFGPIANSISDAFDAEERVFQFKRHDFETVHEVLISYSKELDLEIMIEDKELPLDIAKVVMRSQNFRRLADSLGINLKDVAHAVEQACIEAYTYESILSNLTRLFMDPRLIDQSGKLMDSHAEILLAMDTQDLEALETLFPNHQLTEDELKKQILSLGRERKLKSLRYIAENVDLNQLEGHGGSILATYSTLRWGLEYNIDILDQLVSRGADLNYTSQNGFTPVVIAAISKHAKASKRLFDLGAKVSNPLVESDTGFSLAHLLAYYDQKEMKFSVYGHSGFQDENGEYLDLLEIFARAGLDFNVVDNDGNTPAHYAIYPKNLIALKRLHRHRFDIHKPNYSGKTPKELVEEKDLSEEDKLGFRNFFESLD